MYMYMYMYTCQLIVHVCIFVTSHFNTNYAQQLVLYCHIRYPYLIILACFLLATLYLILLFAAGSKDNESAEQYFQHVMDSSGTMILWPSRLKIGAKSKKGCY